MEMNIETDLINDQVDGKGRLLHSSYIFQSTTISSRSMYHLGMAMGDLFAPVDYVLHTIFPDYTRIISQLYSKNERYFISGVVGQTLGLILYVPGFIAGVTLGIAMYVIDRIVVETINSFRNALKKCLDFQQKYVEAFNATRPQYPMKNDQVYILTNACTIIIHSLVAMCAVPAHVIDKIFLPNDSAIVGSAVLTAGIFASYYLGNALGLVLSIPGIPLIYLIDKLSQVYEELRLGLETVAAWAYVINDAVDCDTAVPQDVLFQEVRRSERVSALEKPIHSKTFSESHAFFKNETTGSFATIITGNLTDRRVNA